MNDLCGAIFNYPNSSSSYNALELPTFPCSGCGKSFPTKRGRESHVVGVHLGLVIPCGVDGCRFGPFKQESSYRRHVVGNSKHASKHIDVIQEFRSPQSFPTNMFACRSPRCHGTFTEPREFSNHVLNEHLTCIHCPVCMKIEVEWSAARMPALMEHLYVVHAQLMMQYIPKKLSANGRGVLKAHCFKVGPSIELSRSVANLAYSELRKRETNVLTPPTHPEQRVHSCRPPKRNLLVPVSPCISNFGTSSSCFGGGKSRRLANAFLDSIPFPHVTVNKLVPTRSPRRRTHTTTRPPIVAMCIVHPDFHLDRAVDQLAMINEGKTQIHIKAPSLVDSTLDEAHRSLYEYYCTVIAALHEGRNARRTLSSLGKHRLKLWRTRTIDVIARPDVTAAFRCERVCV